MPEPVVINGIICSRRLRLTCVDGKFLVSVVDLFAAVGCPRPSMTWQNHCNRDPGLHQHSLMLELGGPPTTSVVTCDVALELLAATGKQEAQEFRLAVGATLVARMGGDQALLTSSSAQPYLPPITAEAQECLFTISSNNHSSGEVSGKARPCNLLPSAVSQLQVYRDNTKQFVNDTVVDSAWLFRTTCRQLNCAVTNPLNFELWSCLYLYGYKKLAVLAFSAKLLLI